MHKQASRPNKRLGHTDRCQRRRSAVAVVIVWWAFLQTLGDFGDFVVSENLIEQPFAELRDGIPSGLFVFILNESGIPQPWHPPMDSGVRNVDVVSSVQIVVNGPGFERKICVAQKAQNGLVVFSQPEHWTHSPLLRTGFGLVTPGSILSECIHLLFDVCKCLTPTVSRCTHSYKLYALCVVKQGIKGVIRRRRKLVGGRVWSADALLPARTMYENANAQKATDCFARKDHLTSRISKGAA